MPPSRPPSKARAATPRADTPAPRAWTAWLPGILEGVSAGMFFLACMALPLVGRASAATPWHGRNALCFAAILLAGLGCAGAARLPSLRPAGRSTRLATLLAAVFAAMLALLALGVFAA